METFFIWKFNNATHKMFQVQGKLFWFWIRRKRNLLFLPTSGINRISDVLLLLLLGSTLFSLMALFNFVRLLFFNAKVNPTDMNTYVNTDISLVYLSLLFILTLFNLLTTFIYCSKNRLHSQPDSNCEEELKQVKIPVKLKSL